ncbi:hypothetical protein T03_17780 [Trichinella britovi]|uniref:Uncharacterized protein n=2 Tax=Trichinella TaxID=6333 RepID=A0A0V1CRA4_TRIBR|nr:hypothetical protein T05_14813 [Trichinella murrelli]KRY51702.1 hypothetical protein T03_17780 [Trichinella britovi]KRZ84334.1 hypothetical protein T08_6940 [Trichinella sp. T8]
MSMLTMFLNPLSYNESAKQDDPQPICKISERFRYFISTLPNLRNSPYGCFNLTEYTMWAAHNAHLW